SRPALLSKARSVTGTFGKPLPQRDHFSDAVQVAGVLKGSPSTVAKTPPARLPTNSALRPSGIGSIISEVATARPWAPTKKLVKVAVRSLSTLSQVRPPSRV